MLVSQLRSDQPTLRGVSLVAQNVGHVMHATCTRIFLDSVGCAMCAVHFLNGVAARENIRGQCICIAMPQNECARALFMGALDHFHRVACSRSAIALGCCVLGSRFDPTVGSYF